MTNDSKSENDAPTSFFKRFLTIWGITTVAAIGPFVFQFGLLRIWILLLVTAGISILLTPIIPLFYKKTVTQDLPKIQEWKRDGDVLSLIKYLNVHAPDAFNPVWKEAINAVIEMGSRALPMLIDALDAETPYVPPRVNTEAANRFLLNILRVNVAYCIGEIGDKSAIPALENALRKYKKEKNVCEEIESALSKLGVSIEEIKQTRK